MRVTIPELSLVLLIGSPGSGKNKMAAQHFRPSELLSWETVRQMVAGEEPGA
jgi:protein phosphatase